MVLDSHNFACVILLVLRNGEFVILDLRNSLTQMLPARFAFTI